MGSEHRPHQQTEPVAFIIPEDSEYRAIQNQIADVAGESLFRYTDYKFNFPTLRSAGCDKSVVQRLFVSRDPDELRQVATDTSGSLKRLHGAQLASIRETGTFSVPSALFPANQHVWRLSEIFQKGCHMSRLTFYRWLAAAYGLVYIEGYNRVFGRGVFCLRNSVVSVGQGLWQLVDLVVGAAHYRYTAPPIDSLTLWTVALANLFTPDGCDEFERIAAAVEAWYERNKDREKHFDTLQPTNLAYVTLQLLDGASDQYPGYIYHSKTWAAVLQHVAAIIKRLNSDTDWLTELKYDVIAANPGLAKEEIEVSIQQAAEARFFEMLTAEIRKSEELKRINPRLPERLERLLEVGREVRACRERETAGRDRKVREYEARLRRDHPIRSLNGPWLRGQLDTLEGVLGERLEARVDQFSREREEGWVGSVRAARTEHEVEMARLAESLGGQRRREHRFSISHSLMIWSPSNYIVTNTTTGQRVPTVFGSHDYRPPPRARYHLSLSTTREIRVCSGWLWRWRDALQFTRVAFWNSAFVLLVVVPFVLPVSLKALVWPREYYIGHSLVGDRVCPRTKVRPLKARLDGLYAGIARSRAAFEAAPDTGLLGKAVTRAFNRVWNYLFKGLVGTLLLLTAVPVVTVGASAGSLALGLATPLWAPLAGLGYFLLQTLLFDFNLPRDRALPLLHAVVWRVGVKGALQPAACLLLALIGYPCCAAVLCVLGSLQFGVRNWYDFSVYHVFLKHLARVPASDSFAAKRVSGPGMASHYFRQIAPDHALVPVHFWADRLAEQAWFEYHRAQIQLPLARYSAFVRCLFAPFCSASDGSGTYSALVRQQTALLAALDSHRRRLTDQLALSIQDRERIRLRAADLDRLVALAAQYLAHALPRDVFPYWEETAAAGWWAERRLRAGDWVGLAQDVLAQVYSSSLLFPLEEADLRSCFRLEVKPMGLDGYLQGLLDNDLPPDPLDIHTVTYKRLSHNIHVQAPTFESGALLERPLAPLVKHEDVVGVLLARRLPFLLRHAQPSVAHLWAQLGARQPATSGHSPSEA